MVLETTNHPTKRAAVRLGNRRWLMAPGEVLTFGRGLGRDIRFAHEPEDDLVSRHAGTLTALPTGILIHNNSTTQPVLLQAFPGPERTIGPGEAVATLPYGQLRMVVSGRYGTRYSFVLDTRPLQLGAAAQSLQPVGSSRASTTMAGAKRTVPGGSRLTAREKRFLAALCEPLLTLAGPEAVAASNPEIAIRVGATRDSVKECLHVIRTQLTEVDGIPGLRDTETSQTVDPHAALARWAIDSRTITADNLTELLARNSKAS